MTVSQKTKAEEQFQRLKETKTDTTNTMHDSGSGGEKGFYEGLKEISDLISHEDSPKSAIIIVGVLVEPKRQ